MCSEVGCIGGIHRTRNMPGGEAEALRIFGEDGLVSGGRRGHRTSFKLKSLQKLRGCFPTRQGSGRPVLSLSPCPHPDPPPPSAGEGVWILPPPPQLRGRVRVGVLRMLRKG